MFQAVNQQRNGISQGFRKCCHNNTSIFHQDVIGEFVFAQARDGFDGDILQLLIF